MWRGGGISCSLFQLLWISFDAFSHSTNSSNITGPENKRNSLLWSSLFQCWCTTFIEHSPLKWHILKWKRKRYSHWNLARTMTWVGHVTCMGEMRNAYKILVRKPEEKRQLRWKDNIWMDLRETGGEGMNWIHLAQDRDQWWALVNMNLQAA